MSILFKPGKIGSMNLKNRFVRSATAECLASDDCRVTDEYLRAYERLARGGVGLIVPGNFYINQAGRALPRIMVLDNDEIIDDLKKIADVVHKHDAKIVAQLNHGGRQCDPKVLGARPIAPSPVRDKLTFVKPREMTSLEVEETITAFGEAARRVKKAGFDGVQIHVAHGYLINQFLSSYTNRRGDKWGGPLENRMRFLVEVYKLIRSIVGEKYPILVKINSEDFKRGGVTLEECVEVCKKLEELGIDAIEVSGGIAEKGLVIIRGDLPIDLVVKGRKLIERILARIFQKPAKRMFRFREAYFLTQAVAIKKNVSVPVIAVGGMRHRETMEQALENSQADYISMCRPFIRQPGLVNQMEKKDGDPISCISCNRCSIEIILHFNPMKCYRSQLPE